MKPAVYLKRPRAAATGPWSVAALCAAYSWPTSAPGGGTIAIVELGGGWVQSDLDAFCSANGMPKLTVTDVSVDGTTNTPDPSQNSADFEVALDIEVAASAYFHATGGKLPQVRVYWAQDIATAVLAASKDGCAVCSISWGAPENQWGNAAVQAMEQAAIAATQAGMVVFAASGDNDADDGSGQVEVDCPACCPHVVACGGTSKVSGGVESVWNNDSDPNDPSGEGTGGGYSAIFPVQSFQLGAPAPKPGLGRMVPDVAANADPNTGYEIYCHGSALTIGGTSAVAPLYAGLFASFGKGLGFVSPTLWNSPGAFTDITQGGNGLYQASKGPDPCTGLGAPIGSKLLALFASAQPAPTPPAPTPPAPTQKPDLSVVLAAFDAAVDQGDPLEDRDQIKALAAAALTPLWPPS